MAIPKVPLKIATFLLIILVVHVSFFTSDLKADSLAHHYLPKTQVVVGLKMKTLSHTPLTLNPLSPDINIIFSSLFSIYFLMYCLREFVQISSHLISADHCIHSLYEYI